MSKVVEVVGNLDGLVDDRKDCQEDRQGDGGHARNGSNNEDNPPGKRKRGRPKGVSNRQSKLLKADPTGQLAEADTRQLVSRGIKARQVKDCQKISRRLTAALSKTGQSPDDLGKLTRAVSMLHDLERNAYGLGAKDSQAQKIIIMPVRAESMIEWQADSDPQLPKVASVPVVDCVGVVEDDIQGEAPPEPDLDADKGKVAK